LSPLSELDSRIVDCRACPRLVAWREQVAREKRASYADETYWGRPVPGFGSVEPSLLIVGLAPAAHGANRTGRIFTGDRSGDWLFASLYRVGLANQPTSIRADDGLELRGTRVVSAVRCAPPQNKPTTEERDTCAPFLHEELSLVLPHVRAVVALGGFGWDAAFRALAASGLAVPRPRPKFGHGVEVRIGELTVLGCFHPSQQNTFTGRLTEPMLDAVLGRAAEVAGLTH
jgi:uracil-DNA glycosylase family 4